jgi:hypothetical protein
MALPIFHKRPTILLFSIIFFSSLLSDYTSKANKEDVILFIAVKSGPGRKNERYRSTARKTWLDKNMKGVEVENGFAYKFFVDGPCCEVFIGVFFFAFFLFTCAPCLRV